MNGIKKFICLLVCAFTLSFTLTGCGPSVSNQFEPEAINDNIVTQSSGAEQAPEAVPDAREDEAPPTRSHSSDSGSKRFDKHDVSEEALEYALDTIKEDGVYTTPATVAAYIYTFNKLPSNFITKKEAEQLGWVSSKGNLTDVAPGKSIGGDRFGNYEGQLPKGNYRECDVNYKSGRRGAERIIFSKDGDIYYTKDHYSTFEKLF